MITETHSQLYTKYTDDAYLKTLNDYSKWTVPSLFPRDVKQGKRYGNNDIEHDFQSVGAMLVNRMAAKLTQTLFPINHTFFKINVSADKLKEMGIPLPNVQVFDEETRQVFAEYENTACKRLYINNSYAQLQQALALLIVTGNALLMRKDNRFVVYSLHNYTTLRDSMGDLLDLIIKEDMVYEALPKDFKERLAAHNKVPHVEFKTVTVYTRIKRVFNDYGNTWEVTQQVEDVDMGVDITYNDYNNPYIVATWKLVNGDNYGRGHCEDHRGDLAKLSAVSGFLTDYEIEALKIVNLVDTTTLTDFDEVANADHGAFVQGVQGSITAYEAGTYQKIQAALQDLQIIYQRLSMAFMDSSNSRDAERVTAEEIRNNVYEADMMTGGVFSNLSPTLHAKTGYLLMQEVDPAFIIAVAAGLFDLELLTGVQAVGRSSDTQKLMEASIEFATIATSLQQTQQPFFDYNTLAKYIFTNRGVPLDVIMKSQEQLAAELEMQKQQQAQMQQQMADPTGAASMEAAMQATATGY